MQTTQNKTKTTTAPTSHGELHISLCRRFWFALVNSALAVLEVSGPHNAFAAFADAVNEHCLHFVDDRRVCLERVGHLSEHCHSAEVATACCGSAQQMSTNTSRTAKQK